jgi:hypothetical protein
MPRAFLAFNRSSFVANGWRRCPGEIIACGDKRTHEEALKLLDWQGLSHQAEETRDVTFRSWMLTASATAMQWGNMKKLFEPKVPSNYTSLGSPSLGSPRIIMECYEWCSLLFILITSLNQSPVRECGMRAVPSLLHFPLSEVISCYFEVRNRGLEIRGWHSTSRDEFGGGIYFGEAAI